MIFEQLAMVAILFFSKRGQNFADTGFYSYKHSLQI